MTGLCSGFQEWWFWKVWWFSVLAKALCRWFPRSETYLVKAQVREEIGTLSLILNGWSTICILAIRSCWSNSPFKNDWLDSKLEHDSDSMGNKTWISLVWSSTSSLVVGLDMLSVMRLMSSGDVWVVEWEGVWSDGVMILVLMGDVEMLMRWWAGGEDVCFACQWMMNA